MRKTAEKMVSVLVLICLACCFSASRAEIPLPVSLLWGNPSDPVVCIASEPTVGKLSQYDENRTEQLNKLIRHLGVTLTVDGNLSNTGILVDGKEVFSYLQNGNDESLQTIYSFEPSRVYTEKQESETGDADAFLSFLENDFSMMTRYLDDFYDLLIAAPEAFPDRTRTEKTELNFSGFGKAVRRVTVSFPADFVQEKFPGALADLAVTARCKAFLDGLVFSGNQRIGILYDADGKPVRLSYDGSVGGSAETLRKTSLIWKCLREEGHQKDGITLKTPAVTGADKDNIAFTRDLDFAEESAGSLQLEMQIDHRAGKEDRKLVSYQARMTKADATISGDLVYSVKRDGIIRKTTARPELREENGGEYQGTLEIAEYSGKIEKSRIALNVLFRKGDPLQWSGGAVSRSAETPDSTTDSGADSPEERITTLVVRSLLELPDEDLAFFSDGIPDATWQELKP